MIDTPRLLIRPEEPKDAKALQRLLADPIGRKYTGGVKTQSIEQLINRLHTQRAKITTDWEKIKSGEGHFACGVTLKRTDEYIGYCGIRYCDIMNRVELLYGFLKEYWGFGYGKEAAKAMLKYGFEQIKSPELFAAVNPANIASERILRSIGMKYSDKIDWPEQGKVNLYRLAKEEFFQNETNTKEVKIRKN